MSEQADLRVAIHHGDIVRLKSGGPDMTVLTLMNDRSWLCIWDDGHGNASSDFFDAETLDLVLAEKDVGFLYHYHLTSSASLGTGKHAWGVVGTAVPINTENRFKAIRERIARDLGIEPDFCIDSLTLLNP